MMSTEAREELKLQRLRRATDGANSIKQADITEIKAIKVPRDIVKIVFDCVNILFMQPLDPVTPKRIDIAKAEHSFITDSFDRHSSKNMTGPLLANVLYFAENEMDCINDETIELLEPYLNLRNSKNSKQKLLDPEIAINTSAALAGLSSWVIGMSDYAKESSKGKQVLLSLKEDGLDDQ